MGDSTMKSQRVLLVGATGLVGNCCLEHLLADDTFTRVIALTRRPLEKRHTKLSEHVIDFDQLADQGQWLQADTVFCCLGTTLRAAGSKAAFAKVDYGYVEQLAKLALSRGVKQFLLVSALGASIYSPVFYSRVKGEAEQAVLTRGFPTVHILRPSMLLGARQHRRLNEELTKPLAIAMTPLLIGPLKYLRPVTADKVAALMITLAKREQPGVHIHYPSAL